MKRRAGKAGTVVARRRTGSVRLSAPRAANDNTPGVRPAQHYVWSIYRAAARARWVGQVTASTDGEAIEAAAVEFSTDAWKLIAVRRYEIA